MRLTGEVPEADADLDALVREALEELEVFAPLRFAEELVVHLLVEHDGTHSGKDREHVELARALSLVDDGLEVVSEIPVAEFAVVALESLVVDGADLRFVDVAPALEETGHVLAHLGLHVCHTSFQLDGISGVRLGVHVHPAVNDLRMHGGKGHAELPGGFGEAAHEGGHIHGG